MLFDPGACCPCSSTPACSIKFRVLGCNSAPLQGAFVRVYDTTARVVATGSGYTDANGEVTIAADKAGSNYYKVDPPAVAYADRLNPITTGTAIYGCGNANFNVATLTAKTGYACCNVADLKPPYPIPRQLELETKYNVDLVNVTLGCAVTVSLNHEADDVWEKYYITSEDVVECPTPPPTYGYLGGNVDLSAIGHKACYVTYSLSFGGANPSATESTATGNDANPVSYRDPTCQAAPPPGDPIPPPLVRYWRWAGGGTSPRQWTSVSYNLVSMYPFEIHYTMDNSGAGYGPWVGSAPANWGKNITDVIILREPGGAAPLAAVETAQPEYPSLAKQAANALGSAARFVASGGATVSQEEFDRRRAICLACPSKRYVAAEDRCEACGCYLAIKPWGKSERCPEGHW